MNDNINRIPTIRRGLENFLEKQHTGDDIIDSTVLKNLSEVLGWTLALSNIGNISVSEQLFSGMFVFRENFERIYSKGANQVINKHEFDKGVDIANEVLAELEK